MPSQSYPWFTFLSNACASAHRPLRSCGEWLRTCTIITGEPNELVAQIHSRMPAILPEQHHAAWLGETDNENLEELLLPYPPDEMGMWEISPRVNSPKNDDASL